MRRDIEERKEDILLWISKNYSKAYMCKQLKCKPETLNSYLKLFGVQYSGNRGLKGIKISSKCKSAHEYAKSSCVKSHTLKNKLIKDGIKQRKCELCGNEYWLGKPIPLELHHVDGNHFNNDFSNLLILCPNCHAMQNNNSGSNVGKYNG